MSTLVSKSAKGKTPLGEATHYVDCGESTTEDVFVLASKIEALLKGKSQRTCSKVLNMVGSIHGLRTIRADQPIGQSATVGVTTKVVTPAKEKGKPTPRAAYKQTTEFKSLTDQRLKIINDLKTEKESNKAPLIVNLRAVELSLRNLKGRSAGDQ